MSDDDKIVELRPKKPWSPERKAKWKASIAANPKNHKPAAGNVASGIPASGPGWGGEAKGTIPIEALKSMPRLEPSVKDAMAAEAIATMAEIMRGGEHETNRLNAASKLLDRLEGTPVARQITAEATGEEEWTKTTDRERAKAVALLVAKQKSAG